MFLPVNKKDMKERGWDELDFLYISGDAYVDHPSFGHALITRQLEAEGFRVGIVALPQTKEDYLAMGIPKIAVLISSGVIDSMVNRYTVAKKQRDKDEYAPGGKPGLRPDRADIVYSQKVREYMGDVPIILGGIEASLRRFAHYDYWDDRVRNSILVDSGADLLVYGMGERPFWEISKLIKRGVPVKNIKNINGTAYLSSYEELPKTIQQAVDEVEGRNKETLDEDGGKNNTTSSQEIKKNKKIKFLHSAEEVKKDKVKYAESFKIQYEEQDFKNGSILVQKHNRKYVVQNMPQSPLTTEEMDKGYAYPYERTYHPMYKKDGGVPAIQEVEFSITAQRGCFGACNFCAITFHQGRIIQARSDESILEEAKLLTTLPGFKGYIHDVGGPTANFRHPSCKKQYEHGMCKGRECLYPEPCKNLDTDHSTYLNLLRKIRSIPKIKKVFIRSGIRYDYLLLDKNDEFFKELCEHHVSGQLKVAPEHMVDEVLDKMGKPKASVYLKFAEKYNKINEKLGKKQYLVPYLISSHPGSTMKAAVKLTEYLNKIHYMPQQVQDFYPTPGTISTCMFYTGIDPRNMKKVYVPKDRETKRLQRALLQYRKKENYEMVKKALKEAGREDLIGHGERCIIKPKGENYSSNDKVRYDKKTTNKKQISNKKNKFKKEKASNNNRMKEGKYKWKN